MSTSPSPHTVDGFADLASSASLPASAAAPAVAPPVTAAPAESPLDGAPAAALAPSSPEGASPAAGGGAADGAREGGGDPGTLVQAGTRAAAAAAVAVAPPPRTVGFAPDTATPRVAPAPLPPSDEGDIAAVEAVTQKGGPKHEPERFHRFSTQLGRGAMKTVFKGHDTKEACDVAWSAISISLLNEKSKEDLKLEVKYLMQLQHTNIIKYIDSFYRTDIKELVIITEWMASGTLKEHVAELCEADDEGMSEKSIRKYGRQILAGLQYMHEEHHVVHRDLKLANIFIDHIGVAEPVVKIGDLGLAKDATMGITMSGTPAFMPPELYGVTPELYGVSAAPVAQPQLDADGKPVLTSGSSTSSDDERHDAIDMWSFGLCLLEMVINGTPYGECTHAGMMIQKFRQGTPKLSPIAEMGGAADGSGGAHAELSHLPNAIDIKTGHVRFRSPITRYSKTRKMVMLLLRLDPTERPRAKDLLSNKYFHTETDVLARAVTAATSMIPDTIYYRTYVSGAKLAKIAFVPTLLTPLIIGDTITITFTAAAPVFLANSQPTANINNNGGTTAASSQVDSTGKIWTMTATTTIPAGALNIWAESQFAVNGAAAATVTATVQTSKDATPVTYGGTAYTFTPAVDDTLSVDNVVVKAEFAKDEDGQRWVAPNQYDQKYTLRIYYRDAYMQRAVHPKLYCIKKTGAPMTFHQTELRRGLWAECDWYQYAIAPRAAYMSKREAEGGYTEGEYEAKTKEVAAKNEEYAAEFAKDCKRDLEDHMGNRPFEVKKKKKKGGGASGGVGEGATMETCKVLVQKVEEAIGHVQERKMEQDVKKDMIFKATLERFDKKTEEEKKKRRDEIEAKKLAKIETLEEMWKCVRNIRMLHKTQKDDAAKIVAEAEAKAQAEAEAALPQTMASELEESRIATAQIELQAEQSRAKLQADEVKFADAAAAATSPTRAEEGGISIVQPGAPTASVSAAAYVPPSVDAVSAAASLPVESSGGFVRTPSALQGAAARLLAKEAPREETPLVMRHMNQAASNIASSPSLPQKVQPAPPPSGIGVDTSGRRGGVGVGGVGVGGLSDAFAGVSRDVGGVPSDLPMSSHHRGGDHRGGEAAVAMVPIAQVSTDPTAGWGASPRVGGAGQLDTSFAPRVGGGGASAGGMGAVQLDASFAPPVASVQDPATATHAQQQQQQRMMATLQQQQQQQASST